MQIILVAITVVLALFYLGKQFYSRFFAKKSSCDGCAINKLSKN